MERFGMSDRLAVTVGLPPMAEGIRFRTDLTVARWDEEQTIWAHKRLEVPERVTLRPWHFAQVKVEPYSVTVDEDCNLITTEGEAALLGSIGGTSITNKFNSTFGRIGAGTSTTPPTAADTKLGGDTGGGSTTSYYALCGAGPTITTSASPSTMVFSASFGSGVANFTWQEFGTDNYSASGVTTQGLGGSVIFFNHGLSSQGTKISGQTWSATETMSLGNTSSVS